MWLLFEILAVFLFVPKKFDSLWCFACVRLREKFWFCFEIFSKKLAWFSAGLPAGLGWPGWLARPAGGLWPAGLFAWLAGLALGWPGCRASWLAVRAPLCVFGGAVVVLAGFLFGF